MCFRRFNLAALWLCLLLQRMPALRLAWTDGVSTAVPRVVSLLPSAAALAAALGSVHTLAGATEFVTTTQDVVGPVGTKILPVVFTLIGAPTPVLSFRIVEGELPPGLVIERLESGVINGSPVVISGTPTRAGSYLMTFDAYAEFDATSSTYGTLEIRFSFVDLAPPVIAAQGATAAPGGSVALSVVAAPTPGPSYQWIRNGNPIANATGPIFTLGNVEPATAGLYAAVATNATSSVTSDAAIVGVATTEKVIGAGVEVQGDIRHANGNIFDQVLLNGAAEAITAEPGQVTRTSFIDLNNDIVQVEFSGPGTLSLVLAAASGPALPANYHQSISYMKGYAGIVIVGATKDTNVSVFSVGRETAVNSALFREDVIYDGIADIAFLAISSADGQFGSVRTANVNYFGASGLTGIYAPGVTFSGPVYVGDISALDSAKPVLVLGGVTGDTAITGGDLLQPNNERVLTSGLRSLRFAAGSDSHGRLQTAKPNRAVLWQGGRDATGELVVNP